jgi:hypothetical protein
VLRELDRKCEGEELLKNTSQNFRMRVMYHDFGWRINYIDKAVELMKWV